MPINIYNKPDPTLSPEYQNYLNELSQAKSQLANAQSGGHQSQNPIWDSIDAEIESLTDAEKLSIAEDKDYVDNMNTINIMVQSKFLAMMKPHVEKTKEGQELLTKQLEIVKQLKSKVVEESNAEFNLFKEWQAYSTKNPKVTYDQFLKNRK